MHATSPATELRIYDERSDMPGVVISVAALLRELQRLHPDLMTGTWRIGGGVRGYGLHVMKWDDAFQEGQPLDLPAEEFLGVLLGDQEYIEHGTLEKLDGSGVALGVFDSSWVFLRGAPELAEHLARSFQQTKLISL